MLGFGPISSLPISDVPDALASGEASLRAFPAASGGLNYEIYLTDSVVFGTTIGDTIYDGSSTGTTLTGTAGAYIQIVSPKKNLWFVKRKVGTWTLN